MPVLTRFVVFLSLLGLLSTVGACGDDGDGAADAAAPDAAFETICGNPGDLGNSIGVGKFCDDLGDCSDTTGAPICAILGDPLAHFCTKTCTVDDVGACAEDAACECGNGGCGCTPNICL